MTRLRAAMAAGLCAAFAAAPAHAALAPNYQRAAELNAVIEAVAAALPRYPIDKVIFQKADRYMVVAGPCSVVVRIVGKPLPQGMVGARAFDVRLDKPKS